MKQKISIVIPSYNQGQYLEETICSLLDQQYPDLEIITIDGKSTDSSVDIIKKYSGQLAYWVSEKDNGQSHAINKGFKKCTGTIISWLGSDDLLKPGSLEKINHTFLELPEETGLIYGRSLIFSEKKIIRDDRGYLHQSLERSLAGMTFPQPSSFLRKSLLDRTGLLNENLHFGMDYDLFARMAILSPFHYVDYIFSGYRLHESSKSTTSNQKFINDWIKVFNSIISGCGFNDIEQLLEKINLRIETLQQTEEFFNINRPVNIDKKRLIFYFFTNVIKFDYESENFRRAANLAKYLRKNHADLLHEEADTLVIIKRLKILPPLIIKFLRKFTR